MSFVDYDEFKGMIDNPEPQVEYPSTVVTGSSSGDKYVVVLVGLPASGKTYMTTRLSQYLSFFHGASVKIFNVGNYRRKLCGAKSPASFFDPENVDGVSQREKCAQVAMEDLKAFITEKDMNDKIGFFDATNSTLERRKWILSELTPLMNSHKIIFVESIVNETTILENNIKETKVRMPDYEGMEEKEAVDDFNNRREHYKKLYETLTDSVETGERDLSWIKIVDAGRSVSTNNIHGFLPGKIVQLLMNVHLSPRPIFMSRHGQSNYNKLGKIGGDSGLTDWGEAYALKLAEFVHVNILDLNADGSFKDPEKKQAVHARLFTSSLRRTKETSRHIVHHRCDDGWVIMRPKHLSALDEIFAGVFDGMTYENIQEEAPGEFQKRKEDKLSYRYPRGESYLDVIQRLDTVVHEIECQREPVLIVGHQGILRILYAYFTGGSRDDAPFISIPLNTVIEVSPHSYVCDVRRIDLSPPTDSNDDIEPSSH